MDQEKIGSRIIGVVVGDIEGMIAEIQSELNRAFNTMPDGITVNCSVKFKHMMMDVSAETTVSFPREKVDAAEKCKVTKKRIMNEMAEGTLI